MTVINHRTHLDGFTFAAKKGLCGATLLRTGFTSAGLVEIDLRSGTIRVQALAPFVCDLAATTDEDVARLPASMMVVFDKGQDGLNPALRLFLKLCETFGVARRDMFTCLDRRMFTRVRRDPQITGINQRIGVRVKKDRSNSAHEACD